MGVEVIGAGFGRTGTLSLKVALERLGYGPCYHMTEVFDKPGHVALWEAATRGERVDWELVFGGYGATVDWPAAAFYEDLMERYPEARVILTVRDPDRWYESARGTIYGVQRVARSPLFSLGALISSRARTMQRAALMAADLVWERTFDGRFEDRGYAIKVFEDHNRMVGERVPSDRLLVYEVKEGWGPLCDFLGVDAPEGEPFPHLNDAGEFRARIRKRLVLSGLAAGAALLAGAAALYRLRR